MINYHIFKKAAPLICGLVLTNRCNLRCRHCRIPLRDESELPFVEITTAIDSFYKKGGRCLYLQGGEPFLWHDEQYGIEDVVKYAHRIGFFTVIIYTNGTNPINTSADTVFVSIDGLKDAHDFMRGNTFDKIMENIDVSDHSSIFANYTINNHNKGQVGKFCEYVNNRKHIRGIFFYFHTPYYGKDELYIESEERRMILDKLLEYKKKFRILNSRAGLKSAMRNDWKRPLDICSVYEKGNVYTCCRYPGNSELCQNCGYLSYAEIDQTLKLKPSAIVNALKYF